jgi:hypothetical protein
MKELHGCTCNEGTWEASLDTMPMHEKTLRVKGICTCPTTGYKVRLVRAEPQGINPEILILRLETTPPGGMAGQMMTPHEVSYTEMGASYRKVTILPCDITVDVRNIS